MNALTTKYPITEKEWELIQAIRNLRNSHHNPSLELELYTDYLYEGLKEEDTSI